ncbi:hypothetical protein Hanom_Chr05g00430021 [Helianthus anomalus]
MRVETVLKNVADMFVVDLVAEQQVSSLCLEAQEFMIAGRWLDLASLMITSADFLFSKAFNNVETILKTVADVFVVDLVAEQQVSSLCLEAQEFMIAGRWLDLPRLYHQKRQQTYNHHCPFILRYILSIHVYIVEVKMGGSGCEQVG